MRRVLLALGCAVLCACPEKKAPAPIPRAQPQPLEPLEQVVQRVDGGVVTDAGKDERDALYEIVPFTPVGPPRPANAAVLKLVGDSMPAIPEGQAPVLLEAGEDEYLAQVADLLAALDDAHREVWLAHPDAPIAFKLTLRDAARFQEWIDEPVPGKLRVIQRADGFELKTNLGKLPGGDPNGPTVPLRGGQLDLTTLQRGFQKIQAKFKSAPDVCFVPSFGTTLHSIARAMSVDYVRPDAPFFEQLCLIYPRAGAVDAGR
ncbi:MAG: hypothetical protein U0228_03560 [Myxococcaceae bacterium]